MNGWLFKWWNQLICGAVHGHKYKKDGEDFSGHIACHCIKCGKLKVF